MTTPTIRDALERLVSAYAECQGQYEEDWPQYLDGPMAAARAALKAGEVEPSDIEDARLFRLWIREASERPGRLARSICPCITPDQYRDVLRGFATATDIEDALHGGHQTIQEEP